MIDWARVPEEIERPHSGLTTHHVCEFVQSHADEQIAGNLRSQSQTAPSTMELVGETNPSALPIAEGT